MTSYSDLKKYSAFEGENIAYLETLYEDYLQDPHSVSSEWQNYFAQHFQGMQKEPIHSQVKNYFLHLPKQTKIYPVGKIEGGSERRTGVYTSVHEDSSTEPTHKFSTGVELDKKSNEQLNVFHLIQAYRQFGHLQTNIDPLHLMATSPLNQLNLDYYDLSIDDPTEYDADQLAEMHTASVKKILATCQKIYCGSIGFEYEHVDNPAEVSWLRTHIEQFSNTQFSKEQKIELLKQLTATEIFEKALGKKYVGVTRFSVEGGDTQIPLLNYLIHHSTASGVQEIAIGMAHRGRLNVLANVLGMPTEDILAHFEGTHQYHPYRSDDVKYHYGYSSDLQTADGIVHISLAFNPSHLEIVAPVVQGSVRARQDRRHDEKREQVLAIQFHGDSAFSGQGVVMETFALSQTRGFKVGGSIHIVVNNQVGFTTSNVEDTRSSRYCTDSAKMVNIPIFHVNSDDPEAVLFIAQLALDYHHHFHKDVVIDLVCYRRYGHNEGDEPSATQPLMYQTIKKLPTVRQLYADQLIQQNIITDAQAEQMITQYRAAIDNNTPLIPLVKNPQYAKLAPNWSLYENTSWTAKANTALNKKEYDAFVAKITEVPDGFKLQTQVARIIHNRAEAYMGKIPLIWGDAEILAYASLVYEGYRVRLVGQDSGRGTFAHRHAVVYDQTTGAVYSPLNHLSPKQASFTVIDSVLSENGVMAFECGYAGSEPRALVLWEAQYGDFVNGAQVVIDQFLSSSEQKWGRYCGLVLLLPHGYEGAGPEHSSARLERFLQLCAQENMQVCNLTTPAQLFHVLRRQVLRPYRKPLVILSPKALLRKMTSSLEEIFSGEFQLLLPAIHSSAKTIDRLILCSGRVYYDVEEKRMAQKQETIAIVRIEQLYPFPEEALTIELAKYKKTTDIVWCQEEPKNQGAWLFIRARIENCLQLNQVLRYVGRPEAASTAAGYKKLHEEQREQLLAEVLRLDLQ